MDDYFSLDVPPGRYDFTISKGIENLEYHTGITLVEQVIYTTIVMKRWINMPERGWYSSDDHIPVRRSPRENPLLLRWIASEDIHVGHLLQMG
ncbi:MAG: hypothetical protein R3281_02165 [Balneolaceae bacterium]|nr:hypothetical protein [Balneolaceae bacterium]